MFFSLIYNYFQSWLTKGLELSIRYFIFSDILWYLSLFGWVFIHNVVVCLIYLSYKHDLCNHLLRFISYLIIERMTNIIRPGWLIDYCLTFSAFYCHWKNMETQNIVLVVLALNKMSLSCRNRLFSRI